MKKLASLTVGLAAIALLAVLFSLPLIALPGPARGEQGRDQAQAHDGQAIFMAQSCNLCHQVSTAGIEAATKSERMRGPDLVNVATAHDAAWIKSFLKKQTELDGAKHKKEFKGSDDELDTLASWILAQKK